MRTLILWLMAILGFSQSYSHAEPAFFRVGVENEPATLDWHGYQSVNDRFIVSFLMRGLIKYSELGQPECDLCLSYEVDPTGRVYHFRLNPMEKWSDGIPLEPRHFVDAFGRLLNGQNGFAAAAPFKNIEKFKSIDTHTLQIHLKKPAKNFLDALTLTPAYPIRKEFTASTKKDRGLQMAQTVLGPYFLAEWDAGKRMVLEGNPFFLGDRPVFRVDVLFGNHAENVTRFKDGKIDVLSGPTTEDIMSLPNSKTETRPVWSTRLLVLQTKQGPLQDKSLRRALALAIPRSTLSAVLKNGERSAQGILPPGIPGHPALPAPPLFDLTKAQAERHRAVPWPREVPLTLLHADQHADTKVAQWLVESLAKIHLRLTLKSVPPRDFFKEWAKDKTDLTLLTWVFESASSQDLLDLLKLKKEGVPLEQVAKDAESESFSVVTLGYPSQSYLLGRRIQSFAVTPYGEPDLVKILVPTN